MGKSMGFFTVKMFLGKKKHQFLVGGFNSSEKYEFVSWDYDIPN